MSSVVTCNNANSKYDRKTTKFLKNIRDVKRFFESTNFFSNSSKKQHPSEKLRPDAKFPETFKQ